MSSGPATGAVSAEVSANSGLVSRGIPVPHDVLRGAAATCIFPSAVIVNGVLSTRNGPSIRTVAVNGPATFFGSRHESEQVPPHPYEKL